MIRLDRVTVTYPDAAQPTLRDVDLTIAEGELVLVSGRTGAGSSFADTRRTQPEQT